MAVWVKQIIMITIAMVLALWVGYYAGKTDGLVDGLTQYQECVYKGATGWYIKGKNLSCIY